MSGSTIDHSNILNGDSDTWDVEFGSGCAYNVYRNYEFDLTVYFQNGSYVNNANVTISNSYLGSSDSWLTFANGSIPQQVYDMGHYNITGGDTIYSYNPYNLTISMSGYETYTDLVNITRKENLRVSLTPTSSVIDYSVVFLAIGLSIGIAIVFTGLRFD